MKIQYGQPCANVSLNIKLLHWRHNIASHVPMCLNHQVTTLKIQYGQQCVKVPLNIKLLLSLFCFGFPTLCDCSMFSRVILVPVRAATLITMPSVSSFCSSRTGTDTLREDFLEYSSKASCLSSSWDTLLCFSRFLFLYIYQRWKFSGFFRKSGF